MPTGREQQGHTGWERRKPSCASCASLLKAVLPCPPRRGFSLLELLVVMVIMSILSGLIMGGVMAARRRGGVTKTKALIIRLDLAISQYENSFGDFPPGAGGPKSAEDLYQNLTSPKCTAQQEFSRKELADTDDNGRQELVDHWGQPLSYYHHRSYSAPPKETTFRIISKGPDGKEGTRDDISNFQ